MPGLDRGRPRVWRYVFIYPNTAIDLYPDQVTTWQIAPDGVPATRDTAMAYRAPATQPAHAARPALNTS